MLTKASEVSPNRWWLTNKEIVGSFIILLVFGAATVYLNETIYDCRLLANCIPPSTIHPPAIYCSEEADRRGPYQSVIAYSLYGNFSNPDHFKRYAEPIKFILSNISQFFPEWIVRVYLEVEDDNHLLKHLFKPYSFVDLCNVKRVTESINITRPLFPMTWRFLPLLDPNVDRLLSRDTDSFISKRESDSVQQWLTESDATFHLMRDHFLHCVEILGGLWGAKIYQRRSAIKQAAEKFFYHFEHKMIRAFDQDILWQFIWPLAKTDSLAHDSFCCQQFRGTSPFPTQRNDTKFVGQLAGGDSLSKMCPEQCRPKQHLDWMYC